MFHSDAFSDVHVRVNPVYVQTLPLAFSTGVHHASFLQPLVEVPIISF